jgi:MFS transporter, UMF1 family
VTTALGAASIDNPRALYVGPVIAVWFLLASLPTFALLRDRSVGRPLPAGASWLTVGYRQVWRTLSEAARYRDLFVFLVGHTFAMAGLSIVISFAFIYGDQVIHWSPGTQAAMFVLTQFTAAAGALGFGWLQGRIGDKPTYLLTLAVWCVAVALIRFTPQVSDWVAAAGLPASPEQVFLGVGVVAGLCIGSTQSAGRTLVALLSPADRMGEFFGLWGMFGKLAAIVGLMSLGVLQQLFGLQGAILVTGVFFFLALGVTALVDVDRGRANLRS